MSRVAVRAVILTEGQYRAAAEALTARLSGEIESGPGWPSRASYDGAEAAFSSPATGDVVLVLSAAEARGLATLAQHGLANFLNNPAAQRGSMKGPAAINTADRALRRLELLNKASGR